MSSKEVINVTFRFLLSLFFMTLLFLMHLVGKRHRVFCCAHRRIVGC